MRIIKKYPNRRLYDTEMSAYITLNDIKQLVLQHIPFTVIDAKTDKSVTNLMLLQIIHEEESGKSPLFTTEILQNIIRYYGNPLQTMMSEFLEKSFSAFNQNPEDLKSQSLNLMNEITKRNIEIFQNLTENFFKQKNNKDKK